MTDTMTDYATDNGPDLLYGVSKIADYLGINRRVAYHLIETGRLPAFKIGKTVCARRSKLTAAIEEMEQEGSR